MVAAADSVVGALLLALVIVYVRLIQRVARLEGRLDEIDRRKSSE